MDKFRSGPLILVAFLLGACTYKMRLGEDFYQSPQQAAAAQSESKAQEALRRKGPQPALPQPPVSKLPLTVGVVKGDPFPPLEGGHCMGLIGDPWVETKIGGDYETAFVSALSNYFQSVLVFPTMEPKQYADVLVKFHRSFPENVGLSLYDPKTKVLLENVSVPFVTDPQHLLDRPCNIFVLSLSSLFWDVLGWDILFPAWAPFAEAHDYKEALGGMQENLSNTMSEISQRAASSQSIVKLLPVGYVVAPSRPPDSVPSDGQMTKDEQELMLAKDWERQLSEYLLDPSNADPHFHVIAVGLEKGMIVVSIDREDQLAAIKEFVEEYPTGNPEISGRVIYRAEKPAVPASR